MKPVYSNIDLKPGAINEGIVKVQVVPREWLLSDPIIDFNTGRVLTAVQLTPGNSWITFEFAPLTYLYDEKAKSSKSGSFYQITLSGSLNNHDAVVQQITGTLRFHEMIAIVMDRQKRIKLVGSQAAGLVFIPSKKLLNTNGGQLESTIEMVMESEDPAPYYEV